MEHSWTLANAYRAIRRGERPWTALGNFLNAWSDTDDGDAAGAARRADLVAEPVLPPPSASEAEERWAAFCAAAVEYLCAREAVPCPTWARAAGERLREPWFHAAHPEQPGVQARLVRDTPEPFVRRNIYGSAHMLATKYDFAAAARRGRGSADADQENKSETPS